MRERRVVKAEDWEMILLIIVFLIGVLAAANRADVSVKGKIAGYSEGWYCEEEGAEKEITLPYKKAGTKEGLTIYRKLTEEERGKTIYLAVSNQWLEVYGDGELLYEQETYATPKYENAPVNGFCYVDIPEDTEQLTIHTSSPYRKLSNNIGRIYLGSRSDLLIFHYTYYFYNTLLDSLIILIGIGFFFGGLYLYRFGEENRRVKRFSITIILLGAWLRTGTGGLEIKYLSHASIMYLSYLFWFLLLISVCQFLKVYSGDYVKWYQWLERLFVINAVCNFVLERMGIINYIEAIKVSHTLLCATAAVTLAIIVMRIRKGQYKESLSRICSTVGVCIFAALELVQYYRTGVAIGFFIRVGVCCCIAFIMIGEVRNIEKKKEERLRREEEQKELQLQITLDQLQPHFIFNALGAIRIMIHTDREQAYDMLYDFSKFVRASLYSLRIDGLIPFSRELTQIRAYLNIEKKRFSDRIEAEYQIETEDFEIPPLTVEPFVVNAVQHGLRKGKEGGKVSISTRAAGDVIQIEVKDNGIGFDVGKWKEENTARQEKTGHKEFFYTGIFNMTRRLEIKLHATVSISSEENIGTVVLIEIPKNKRGENYENNIGG